MVNFAEPSMRSKSRQLVRIPLSQPPQPPALLKLIDNNNNNTTYNNNNINKVLPELPYLNIRNSKIKSNQQESSYQAILKSMKNNKQPARQASYNYAINNPVKFSKATQTDQRKNSNKITARRSLKTSSGSSCETSNCIKDEQQSLKISTLSSSYTSNGSNESSSNESSSLFRRSSSTLALSSAFNKNGNKISTKVSSSNSKNFAYNSYPMKFDEPILTSKKPFTHKVKYDFYQDSKRASSSSTIDITKHKSNIESKNKSLNELLEKKPNKQNVLKHSTSGELVKIASYDPINDDLVADKSILSKNKDLIHKENNDGTISLNLDLPANIDPTNINVILNEKKILIKSKLTNDILYVISLPENTDFNELEYSLEKIDHPPSSLDSSDQFKKNSNVKNTETLFKHIPILDTILI